jgi:hypothetical protein
MSGLSGAASVGSRPTAYPDSQIDKSNRREFKHLALDVIFHDWNINGME